MFNVSYSPSYFSTLFIVHNHNIHDYKNYKDFEFTSFLFMNNVV